MKKFTLLFIAIIALVFTGLSQTVNISGNIIDQDGVALAGVTVAFSNSGGTVTTDANGDYSHDVNYGYSGVATPILTGYSFTPGSIEYTNLTGNATNQDYTGSNLGIFISGTILDDYGNPIPLVTVTFDNGGGSTETNSAGFYSITVDYGYTGTATPNKSGYSFTPATRSYNNVNSSLTNEDYNGLLSTINISGNIVDQDNAPLANVTITFSNGGGTATTDNNGDYSHNVDYGYSGVATATLAGYSFIPAFIEYTNLSGDAINQNYIGDVISTISENYFNNVKVSVYPNPAITDVMFEIETKIIAKSIDVFVYNSLGGQIKKFSIAPSNKKTLINWNNINDVKINNGNNIYYYKVFVNNKAVKSGKIITVF